MSRSFRYKLPVALLLLAGADFLFFGQNYIGWVAGVYALLLLVSFLILNPASIRNREGQFLYFIAVIESFVMMENPSALSGAVYIFALAGLAVSSRAAWHENACLLLNRMTRFFVSAPLRLPDDMLAWKLLTPGAKQKAGNTQIVRKWALPVVLAIVFIMLFSMANPVIAQWAHKLDLFLLFDTISVKRIIFWILVAAAIWPFLRPRFKTAMETKTARTSRSAQMIDWLFNPESILRSLIVFNLLFALQTVMDVMYLWGGTALPEGLTYAEYAQKGAYPLVVTALLAALFVLIAMNPKNESHAKRTTVALVYVWIAQNIFLVFSSIWRTNLYVQEYSLTYLRFAAFVWMALVAAGLLYIVIRIALRKSNVWLININALTLLFVLVVCSGLNVSGFIARYNVTHSYEATGRGQRLDVRYLAELGLESLPSIKWLGSKEGLYGKGALETRMRGVEQRLSSILLSRQANWRSWTFRNYRMRESAIHNASVID